MIKVEDLMHDLTEARSELARHHRHFAQIAAIIDGELDDQATHESIQSALIALKSIRKIVG